MRGRADLSIPPSSHRRAALSRPDDQPQRSGATLGVQDELTSRLPDAAFVD
jgi:hypothetical protein